VKLIATGTNIVPVIHMNEEIKISKATFGDLDEILKLQKSAFAPEAEFYDNYDIEPMTQTSESIETDFKNYLFLKAECNSRIIGSVKARETGEFCWIGRLAVDPDFQNRGVGRKLMTEIEESFPHSKLYLLCTGCKSIENLGLYESLGYKRKELMKDDRNCGLLLVKMIKANVKS
jgi:ribosomal protein S18 acetylase RimI-like enzyme